MRTHREYGMGSFVSRVRLRRVLKRSGVRAPTANGGTRFNVVEGGGLFLPLP